MNKVFISPEAARDLTQIKQYISSELKNRSAASRIVGSILKELRTLGRYPEQGPSIGALTGFQTELRMLLCGKHIALYKIEGDTVFVARVLDARQDYLRVLFGDDYWDAEQRREEDIKSRVKTAESLFGIIPDAPTAEPDALPNRETIAAMREAESLARDLSVKGFKDENALFDSLRNDLLILSHAGAL